MMPIHLYNTLSRKKEPFVPLEENKVKMYVCGPTVYNHIHIGNARPAIFFDTVRRYLEYVGYDVHYVHNFTDVDDKILEAARKEGIPAHDVAQKYINAYYEVLDALQIRRADAHPKVTDNIDQIIAFIQALVDRGFAYEAGGDVYFRTERFAEYGKLSHQKTDELLEGVRIELEKHKESPIDFTLWKKSKENEVYWESPWGPGRPGWHIECSTLIKKYLGESIDIHGGGIDLSFPHHENEIAQSETLTEQPLAKYWMHNAMIKIDDQKMSKSLGNFIRVNEVLADHDPQTIRFFMLNGHYRSPLNYSAEQLQQAKNGLERIKNSLSTWKHAEQYLPEDTEVQDDSRQTIEHYQHAFHEAMSDDFNTANAISTLFEYIRAVNANLDEEAYTAADMAAFSAALLEWGDILGLALQEKDVLLDEKVEQLIEERTQARKEKNFARADEIRDYLEQEGIVLEDTRQGVRWRRK